MRSSTAISTSSGALPAPAPMPASEASTRIAPASIAGDGVGDAERQVVVGVDAEFGLRLQRLRNALTRSAILPGQQRAGRSR